MSYTRMTKKKLIDTDISPVLDEHNNVIVDRRLFERFIEQHNRLAELEDKIENGTLIEVLCKVGDTVYQFDNGRSIYELLILGIYIYYGKPYYETNGIDFDNTAIGKSIFLTREEAEKKLKELQE